MKTSQERKEPLLEGSPPARRHWPDFPYWLLVVAVSLVASIPLAQAGYFISDDGIHNLFRLYPLQQAWSEGVLYPRWLSELGFGYGYPLLDFYEPLAFYLGGLFLLLGSGYIAAAKLTCGYIFLAGGLGMYGWGRDLFGRRGAALAAAAYVFAPYFLINIYVRGAFAEALSMAIFPWAFWAARRVAACHSRANIAALAAFTAGIMLSHNIRALLTLPLLALYLALLVCIQAQPLLYYVKKLVLHAGAISLGLAASSFFWAPALFQRSYIQVDAVVRATEDFHPILQHFRGFIQSSLLYTYPATANSTPILLGLAQALTSCASIIAVLVFAWRKGDLSPSGNRQQAPAGPQREPDLPAQVCLVNKKGDGQLATLGEFYATLAFAGAVLLVSLLLQLPGSVPIWEHLPLFNFVEYPFRLLGFSTAAVALFAGALPAVLSHRAGLVLTFLGTLGLGLAALPGLHPSYLRLSDADISPTSIAAHETKSLEVGLGPGGIAEFLPRWVQEPVAAIPQPRKASLSSLVPPSPVFSLHAYSSGSLTLAATSAENSDRALVMHTFYYPSWRATLDGQPVLPYPSTPLGLLTVQLPPGEHTLHVYLDNTPLVKWSTLLSALATGLLILLLAPVPSSGATVIKSKAAMSTILLALLGTTGLAVALLNTGSSRQQPVLSASAMLAPGIQLGGYQISPATGANPPRLVLYYWRTQGAPSDYLAHLQVLDAQGKPVQEFSQTPGDGATLVPDRYELRLPPGLPAGRYQCKIDLRTTQGVPVGNAVLLPATIDLPAGPSLAALPAMTGKINQEITISGSGPEVTLLGYTLHHFPATARYGAGAMVDMTLYWQALVAPGRDYRVFAYLRGGPYNPASYANRWAEQDQEELPLRPTQFWHAGEIIALRYHVYLPRTLTPGSYQLLAGIYDPGSALQPVTVTPHSLALQQGTVLTTLVVAAPPPVGRPARPLSYTVSQHLELKGVTLPSGKDVSPATLQPGSQLPIALFWQGREAIPDNYVIAFHLLDHHQHQVAGIDQEPYAGFYPTSLWQQGEEVQTTSTLPVPTALPPGEYHLTLSIYPRGHPEMPVSILDSAGHTSVALELQTYTVRSTLTTGSVPANLAEKNQAIIFGGSIRLLGYHLERDQSGTLTITFYWQAIKPNPDLTVFVHALQGNTLVTQHDSPPLDGSYPTSRWQPGEIIADQYRLAHVPAGSSIEFGLYNSKTQIRLPVQGEGLEHSADSVRVNR